MAHQIGIELGRRIKELREAKGLTQVQLAEMMGKSVETISNFERGKTIPSVITLQQLSERLKVHIRDFFERTSALEGEPKTSKAARTVMNAAEHMSDDDLEILAGLSKVLEKRRN